MVRPVVPRVTNRWQKDRRNVRCVHARLRSLEIAMANSRLALVARSKWSRPVADSVLLGYNVARITESYRIFTKEYPLGVIISSHSCPLRFVVHLHLCIQQRERADSREKKIYIYIFFFFASGQLQFAAEA